MGIVGSRYIYTQDLLSLESHQSTQSPLQCSRGPSPLTLDRLQVYLSRHPDQQFSSYVSRGLWNGFHIGFSHLSPLRPATHNHPSASENPSVITDHLRDELRSGRLIGPVRPALGHHIQVSPLGLVPKPHSTKWRVIMDLSAPRNLSVNDGISPSLCSLQYASVDSAVDIITQLGQSSELVKLDLSNVYRMIPVHP